MIKLVIRVGLLLAFGFVAILFVDAVAHARTRILTAETAQNDARLAMDYIKHILRTNDVVGRVATADNAILIRHRTAAYELDRWIYFRGGMLVEVLGEPDTRPDPDGENYEVIAKLHDFTVDFDAERMAVIVHIYYDCGDMIHVLTRIIGMRSDIGDGIIIL